MTTKFLRGLQYITGTTGRDMAIFMRICYEFWGYCIHGTNSLTVPGGMPSSATNAPTNFFEGTTVLATGNDGVTSSIGNNFTSLSASFAPSMMFKHITVWHPGSTSTDDSIYQIVGYNSPHQLVLAPFSGGTPDIDTLKNNLTSRSNLRYRVVDVAKASDLSVSSGNYFVANLTGASTINSGQSTSQFQFLLRGTSTTFGKIGIIGSPGGTWNGTTFTGSNISEQNSSATTDYNSGVAGIKGYVTLIGDKDFLIGHCKSTNTNAGSGFYFNVAIPQRIYTQSQDTNPLTIFVGANNWSIGTNTTDSLSNNFAMVDFGGTTRDYQLITRNFSGDGYFYNGFTSTFTIGPNLDQNLTYQSKYNAIIATEALLSYSGTSGQYSLARAKLRPLKFTGTGVPPYHVLGNNGQYIHIVNGIIWPWDGTILPYNLLPLGT